MRSSDKSHFLTFLAHEYDSRKRPISKHFHTQMRQAEKQPVFGPPESMREHVVAASRAMKTGDWNACMNFLINEKMNSKVSKDHFVRLLRH